VFVTNIPGEGGNEDRDRKEGEARYQTGFAIVGIFMEQQKGSGRGKFLAISSELKGPRSRSRPRRWDDTLPVNT
jgi:hypothetical protein